MAKHLLRPVHIIAILAIMMAQVGVVPAAAASLFQVNSPADTADASPGDGVCETAIVGECTLRAAIEEANALPGGDEINFNIPGAGVHTIQPNSALPGITDAVIIDGYTQPGSSPNTLAVGGDAVLQIELDGGLAGLSSGLVINTSNSTVRGLVINRFQGGGPNAGIEINGGSGNLIVGNYIGTNGAGTAGVNTMDEGVWINASNNNTIGGANPGDRNVISANTGNGIFIVGGSTGNILKGNYVGTNAAGTAAIPNLNNGIVLNNADNTTIGGTASGAGNLISGNSITGLKIDLSANVQVMGNRIGTSADGSGAVSGQVDGISVGAVTNLLIGGVNPGEGNLISGNGYGIRLGGIDSTGTRIQGNLIGTDVNGTGAVPNTTGGILIWQGANNNTIGGPASSERNVIAFNTDVGIAVMADTSLGNTIRGNSIFSNGGLGIDLEPGGSTANDPGDSDTGPNNLQNFPVLASAAIAANGNLIITYSVDSLTTSSTYPLTIEFFEADNAPSGEGQTLLGSTTLNAPGSTSFNLGNAAALGISAGDPIVATATDADGNTSEFSVVMSAVDASAFIVTKTADTNDGTCDADCSLREAITAANNTPNGLAPDKILFNIPGAGVRTSQPLSALPIITDPVIIDGYTQPGSQPNTLAVGNNAVLLIELDGTNAGANVIGLRITTGNSIVRGLVINRFNGNGIILDGAAVTGNLVEGNFIGVNTAGNAPLTNGRNGLAIAAGASGNTIGGVAPSARNVISGNTVHGVVITDSTTANNIVQGNYIGTDADGAAPIPNMDRGVAIANSAHDNTIGGIVAGAGNLISGNNSYGLELSTGAAVNFVRGNFVGVDVNGTGALGNAISGILIRSDASGNTIGGTSPEARNLISGNGERGIFITGGGTKDNSVQGNYIGTNVFGADDIANGSAGVEVSAPDNVIGGTAPGAGNLISGNTSTGVRLSGINATGNRIEGNFIGTDATGTFAVPNTENGIAAIGGAANNIIGGTTPAARNIISGNSLHGVNIEGATTTGNLLQGNYIGTAANGMAALPNLHRGVQIDTAANFNTIGGTAAGAGNLISGNAEYGVELAGSGTTANVLFGNFIGVNAVGTGALPNAISGILIRGDASGNTIGGANHDPGVCNRACNVISGNGQRGIFIANTGTIATTNNTIQGNFIGTNVTGSAAIPNLTAGVEVSAPGNIIGGTVAGEGNLISGNQNTGLRLSGADATNNIVQGNRIGTDASGENRLPNSDNGIAIGNAANNIIGGITPGAGNLISGNTNYGLDIAGPGSSGNLIQGNIIGTNASGNLPLPNNAAGVLIRNQASNNVVGGTTAAKRNIISGNGVGLRLVNTGTTGNLIQGNYIGTTPDGLGLRPNVTNGVEIEAQASGNTIGGAGAGNLISGNGANGVRIRNTGTANNLIAANIIGAKADGISALPNGANGVSIFDGAANNLVGGTTAGAGNLIAYNASNGVTVFTPGATGNAIQGNSMVANGELGIDLNNNGLTPNDPADPDTGPNNLQNFPVITTALINASGQFVITYSVDSLSINSGYPLTIEFFTAVNGQGEKFLAREVLGAPGSDVVNLGNAAALGINASDQIVATATDAGGNTSEFSAPTAVTIETTIFTVTKTADTDDGICDADCSLREAILAANASPNGSLPDHIHFNIPGPGVHTIQPTSPLPGITDTVVIDGYTQPGASWNNLAVGNNAVLLIELDGSLAGNASGLFITAPNSTVRGLVINRFVDFPSTLIYLFYAPSADNTIIEGNFLGTDATGTTVFPAQAPDYGITAYSANNRIGTNGDGVNDAGERNVIAGYSTAGIIIGNLPTQNNNIVAGNYVGVNAAGTAALTVSAAARGVWAGDGDGHRIGTDSNGVSDILERNVISGNPLVGVLLTESTSQNVVAGNYIGTDASGTVAVSNGTGISLQSASNTTIGGAAAGAGNLISGNSQHGVLIEGSNATNNTVQGNYIGTDITGTAVLPNLTGIFIQSGAFNNTIGGTTLAARNIISGNVLDGIHMEGAATEGNLVQGNYIGTNVNGTASVANTNGIVIASGASNNIIGGSTAAARNIISGNHGGVNLTDNASGNSVQGNYIGTAATGLVAVPNIEMGVYISSSSTNNIIGTNGDGVADADEGNLISGNGSYGVGVSNSPSNVIAGNYIGVNATGNDAIGNGLAGISMSADNNRIGTNEDGVSDDLERNLISGNNTKGGVWIFGGTGNKIAGNYIGTNASGTGAVPNTRGVWITNALSSNNTVGGTTPAARNIISGNSDTGVYLDVGTSDNKIQGNYIGVDVTGLATLPNGKAGVVIDSSSNNNIGGTAPGEGNVIAHNQQEGVKVLNSIDQSQNDLVRGNSIFANGGLGIDLGGNGQTDNDIGDADTGPNNLQNFSIINIAETLSGKTHVEGLIHSTATADPGTPETFTIDFYAGASCDPISYGEGQTYLGSVTAPTDGLGSGPFQVDLPVLPAGQSFVTATATDADGNTSEFSQCTVAGPDNTAWPFALDLTPTFQNNTAVQSQYLGKQGEARWYRFEVDPGDRLTITLTDLPTNYDLTVYKDIGAIYDLLSDPDTPEDLLLFGAEFADSAFSPDRFTPDRFTPDRFTPDAYSAFAFSPDRFTADVFSPDRFTTDTFSPDRFTSDVFAPDRFTPDRFTPDRFTPDRFTPDRFTPDRFTPDRFTPDPAAFTNAQFRALVAVSAFEGTASEGIAVNTWANDGYYYVRVLGRNGAFSVSEPFTLTVHRTATTCGGVDVGSLPAGSLTAQPGTFDTVILTDPTRLPIDAALQQKLAELAVKTNGVVVNVSADARVAAANRLADSNTTCPYAKNVVAQAIKRVVDLYRPSLKYLVIVGNDGIIPFFRQADQSLLAPESQYAPPVRDASASQASLKNNLVLTQDPYGAELFVSYDAQSLPLPDVAVGRLVETPGEIAGQIDAFLGLGTEALHPRSSLVTGYDFLSDVADAVKIQLDQGLQAPGDKLIADPTLSPYATAQTDPTVPPDKLPWNATQLSQALLGQRHDMIFLAGHFSAQSALAADFQTRLLTSDLVNSPVDLKNTIVFSAGCHSGYNLVDGDGVILAGQSNELDWAQAFARKQAILIAGTGYQYGDTDFVEYSERLYLEFARQLRMGTGPVSVGDALMAAKHEYLTLTPVMRGIHAKAYLEATLFGLPMVNVNLPGRIQPESDSSVATQTQSFSRQAGDAGDQLGLRYQDLENLETPTEEVTKDITNASDYSDIQQATYLLGKGDGEGNNRVLTNPAEPILPLQIVNVSGPEISGQQFVLRGVGFRKGDFSDLPDILPLTGAPATELRGVHGLFTSETFYPVRPWSVNYYDALATGGETFLYITPAQYKSNAPDSDVGTLRVYNKMTLRLFYSANVTDAGAAAPPPAILHVLATAEGDKLNFDVGAVADPVAGVQAVWVTYSDLDHPEAGWRSIDLTQTNPNDSTQWLGSQPFTSPARIRYIVQAVSGTGLVTLSTNVGAYYEADVDPGAPPPAPPPDAPPLPATTLAFVTQPASGEYASETTVTVELTSNGTKIPNAPISLSLGFQTVYLTTGDSDDDLGRATGTFPLIGTPGVYEIRATFAGNEHLAPADDLSAQFVLNKQTTTLKLDPFTTQGLAQFAATLLGSKKRPLGQQTLVFVVSRVNGGYTTVLSGITDLSGRAVSEPLLLPDGSYTVTVYFGQSIPGTDINLASALYGPSSDRVNFSLTSLLDNFNRRAIAPNSGGQHWFGNLGGYRIDSNHLDVGTGGTIYWRGEEFGVNQEAYITFVSVDATSREQGLLLKVQGGKQADFSKGAIKVIYDAQDQAVRVETVRPGAGTVYTNIPVAFQAGDVLGAEVFANGQVWIFKNGTRIAVVTMDAGDQAFFNSRAGQLGLRFISAGNAVLDNFGGRTIIP